MISTDDSIPANSQAGLAARDVFFATFNDVNFYVEDEGQENLYAEILGRLFPKLKIEQIFPLGGKKALVAHCLDPANKAGEKRAIYIADKDFDDLLGTIFSAPNLFYLDLFCIENYLLEDKAVLQLAVENQPREPRARLARELAFDTFLSDCHRSLDPLFRAFFVAQVLDLGIDRTSIQSRSDFRRVAVPGRWTQLGHPRMPTMFVVSESNGGSCHPRMSSRSWLRPRLRCRRPPGAYISGKFLVGLLFHYLRHKVRLGNVTIDSMCYRLARNASLSLTRLRRAIAKRLAAVEVAPPGKRRS